ncbi:MAG: topoisomerase C-terminal repeat-containing protein, partial [Caldilinea sp.]
KPVQAGVGRFGPFVVHDGVYANLRPPDSVLDIELERALELVAAKANGAGSRGASKTVIKELGEHPEGGAVQVLDGRYGPYVNWKKVNATLPKDIQPADVTLAQALEWLAEKQTKPKIARKGGAKAEQPASKKRASTAKSTAKSKKTTIRRATTKSTKKTASI